MSDKQKLNDLIDLYNIRVIEIEEAINLGMTTDGEFAAQMELEVYRMVIQDLKSLLHDELNQRA